MKTIRSIFRHVIVPALATTTVLIFLLLVVFSILNAAGVSDIATPAITLKNALMCLLLAVLVTLSNQIFRIEKITLFSRFLLHFFACLASLIILLLATGYELSQRTISLVLLFVAAYLLIVPASVLIISRARRKEKTDTEYTSMFSPRD